ncbi:MAG TPA: cbb3-type cytochrome c oxidase subunit I [Candidatus Binataceae bacterium]|nr:cbb3-type cytochrome c oxidase subunit I [Candidatus Binataceae bacterium]
MKFGFSRGRPKPRLAVARAAVNFLILASLSFVAGALAAPWALPATRDFFYQPPVLAWVHTFTLGWISSAIIGAILIYVPAFSRPPRFPRLVGLQFILYLIGASGVVSHFLLGSWDGVWMAGVVVVVSILLFALNLIPALAWRARLGAMELALLAALSFFAFAGSVGVLLALDKSLNFLGGDVLRNVSAHAHLAALGWIGVALCAMSYRLVPRLLGLPLKPRTAFAQVGALGVATVGLALALAGAVPGLTLWTMGAALALAVYLVAMGRFVRASRLPVTWPLCHLVASLASLALVLMLGLMLSLSGAQSELGNRLASAYGIAALLGWIGNLIIAASYHMLPAAVARVRRLRGWPVRRLSQVRALQSALFWGFNLALSGMLTGVLAQAGWIAQAAALLLATSGLGCGTVAVWILSFAYRRGRISLDQIPRRRSDYAPP